MLIKGSLFTREFLIDGILEHEEWKNLQESEINDFRAKLHAIFTDFPINGNPIESTTEKDLIEPVIEALGWDSYLTQQTTSKKGRKDVPDYLLFPNAESKQNANSEKQQAKRYRYGLSILEAKAWEIPLDKKGKEFDDRIPSNQILRYLSLADIQSDRNIKWGILTNGRKWRLYFQDAQSRSEDFLEIDLPATLGLKDIQIDLFAFEDSKEQDWLKVFYILFGRKAFLKTPPQNSSFHERALEKGRFWESQVAQDMGYGGDPFIWDEEDRRHRKAKLDALFFNLYEISEEDAAYIMDTFPIVQRHDEEAFDGRYYTKDLILAYMKALKAGDTEAKIKL